MDRPSQEPSDAPESPLSFPVEAPKLAGIEPGAGPPLTFPAEAPADPLGFPVEAPRSPEAPPAAPFGYPATAPPAQPLPFPVAELPGSAAVPQPQPEPQSEPEPVPSGLLRFLPPVLTVVAALMAVGGCFLPLFQVRQHLSASRRFADAQLTVTETAWGSRIEIPGQEATDQAGAPVGIPLVIAVLVLAAAALVAFSRPERGLARWLIAAGAVFTAGVVTTIGMSGLGWSAMADGDLEAVTETGMWLLIGATVVAGAAAVVAYLPVWKRAADWADPALAYADTPTPPSGVAITLLPPDPDEQRP